MQQHPDRFGLFASLPVPDVEASLAEIAYAMDVLNASGITFQSSMHGRYLGDEEYEPLWAELDRRHAVCSAACATRDFASLMMAPQGMLLGSACTRQP